MSANSGGQPPGLIPSQVSNNMGSNNEEEDMEMASPFSNGKSQEDGTNLSADKYFVPQNGTVTGNTPNNIVDLVRNKGPNAASSQNTSRTSYRYSSTDMGPYHVYVENISNDFKGRLNAIKVGDIILSNWPEIDNKIKNIDSIGRNRIRIQFKDYKSANYILDQRNSVIVTNNKLDLYIPKFILFRQGVVRGISTEYSDDVIKRKIKPVDQHCIFEVDTIRRIMRKKIEGDKVNYVNTQTCVVTFKSQTLPKYISVNKVIMQVEPYVQKVLLCYNCYRYGHLGKQCKSSPRCNKCGDRHKSDECQSIGTPTCLHCKGDHITSNLKNCPEFSRQKQIKMAMSQLNVSYNDASKKVPKNSYANVLARNLQSPSINITQNNDTNSIIQKKNHSTTQTNNITPQYITQSQHYTSNIPSKRARPSSPNPLLAATKQITAPISFPRVTGGILAQNVYQENVHSSTCQSDVDHQSDIHNIILELVMYIISNLKNNNNFDIHKRELESLIRNRLNLGATAHSQP